MFNEPDASYHGMVYADHFSETAYIARARSVYQRTTARFWRRFLPSCCCRGWKPLRCASNVMSRTPRKVAEFLARDSRVAWVNYAGFPDNPNYAWPNILAAARPIADFRRCRRSRNGQEILRTRCAS